MKFRLNILISENCGIAQSLPYRIPCAFSVQTREIASNKIKSTVAESPVDGVILGLDESPTALELAENSYTAVLLIAKFTEVPSLMENCAESGVMVCAEGEVSTVLPCFLAACVRLRTIGSRTVSLERKLDDTRIVSRAKLLLMSRLNMSENQAHRYIEKTAMDTGAKRREVAESIIKTYEA